MLSTLHISNNQLGPDDAQTIVGLKDLETLYISHNAIGEAGAIYFGQAIYHGQLAKLQLINLAYNNINMDNVKALLSRSSLLLLE